MSSFAKSLAPIFASGLLFLGLSCFFYISGLLTGRLINRRLKLHLTWTFQVFIVALAIYATARLLGIDFAGRKEIGFLVLGFAAFPINAILHRFWWPVYGYPGEKSRVPTFLPQVVGLMLVIVVCFIGLALFYHVTVTGLLASTGVIAIIIGLALQETLGNIFAGFCLQAGKAYRAGDWLVVDGQHVEVVEINWRSTRFRNEDEESINIPNSQLAKATIVNLYYPTPVHAKRVRVGVEYRVPPNEVKEALVKAAASVKGGLTDPAPEALLISFGDSSINYDLKFWLRDGRCYAQVIDGIRTNCWYEFARRGISFAFPVRVIERSRTGILTSDRKAELLKQHWLCSSLGEAQIERLVQTAKQLRFGKGEPIIRQGEPGESMFILTVGSAEVFAQMKGQLLGVGVLGPGECFGEVSLLTGEPRSASVTARTDCEILEIQKIAIGVILRENPQLAEKLSETLAMRRLATKSELEHFEMDANNNVSVRNKESLLARLRVLFEL
jgi:small-conductance mechanosensitive channel/CRP-like cAMP-binding protein